MKIRVYSFALLILFLTANHAFPQKESLPQLIKRIKPAVVAITTYDKAGEKIAEGSGFFVGPDRVITNRHVIEDAFSATVRTHSGATARVNGILAADEEGDLAIVRVVLPARDVLTPLVISNVKVEEGERVLVIGNPLGLEGTISDGLVSAVRELDKFGAIIQITAPISPGSSGSPVINMRGQVVGIATSQFTKGQNLNFAMPSSRIATLKTGALQTLEQFTLLAKLDKLSQATRLVVQGKKMIWATFIKQPDGALKVDKEANTKAVAEAIPLFIQATRLAPDYADAWNQLGGAYYDQDKYKETVAAYKNAIRLDPNDWVAMSNIAGAYRFLKEYDAAIESLRNLMRIGPRGTLTVDAAARIGDIYLFDLKNEVEAISAYRSGLGIMKVKDKSDDTLRGKLVWAYFIRGGSLSEDGRHDEAIEAYKELLSLNAGGQAGAYRSIGEEYQELKQYSRALAAYKQAVSLKDDFYLAWGNMAYLYLFEFKDNAAAIAACKEAIRIKPDYDYGHYYLGAAYLFSGRKGDALEEYRILKPLNSRLADKLFDVIYDR